jgi:pimeloyl-ACP methyl ester carboxylesterase
MTERTKTEATANTVKVPGATLYYEVRGTGPLLLTIPGGPTDAGVFTALAEVLADRYTVVTYDPRGHSRSAIDGPREDVTVAQHADDAARLIDEVRGEPAYVLGSSGGGTIGLELITRHADKVRRLVVHEPPVMEVLPDRERWRGIFADIYDTYRTQGAFAAMGTFGRAVEEGGPKYSEQQQQGQASPEQAAMMQRMMSNFDFFLAHEIRAIGAYVPDIPALKATRDRIVIAGGKSSGEQGAYRAARALADAIGIELTYFEGGHGGFGASDDAFAQRLRESLSGERAAPVGPRIEQ